MIEETQEDVIFRSRFENSLGASGDLLLITSDNGKIVSRSNMGSFIIDDTASIDIDTSIAARRFVEEFALERI